MTLLLLACASPTSVGMTGSVWDSPDAGSTLPGASVEILDEAAVAFADTVAGDDGGFSVSVPAGEIFYAIVGAEGYVDSGFSGLAGLADFAAPEGYPWAPTVAWADAERAAFSACATWAETGPFVSGEILGSVGAGDLIVVESGTATVVDEAYAVEYPACYLDDDGVSLAEGTETGATGRFAVFGVPSGPIVIDVRYEDSSGAQSVELYQSVMPAEGYVPMYPAIVTLLY